MSHERHGVSNQYSLSNAYKKCTHSTLSSLQDSIQMSYQLLTFHFEYDTPNYLKHFRQMFNVYSVMRYKSGKLVFVCYPVVCKSHMPLRWRRNGRDGVSNHQPRDCLLNRLFRRRSNKISKLCVTGLCAGNSPETGEFPAKMASNAENVSILMTSSWWWHGHHNELWISYNTAPPKCTQWPHTMQPSLLCLLAERQLHIGLFYFEWINICGLQLSAMKCIRGILTETCQLIPKLNQNTIWLMIYKNHKMIEYIYIYYRKIDIIVHRGRTHLRTSTIIGHFWVIFNGSFL